MPNKSMLLIILFAIFWILAISRPILFWVYLWQLKEYHPKRFFDHFNTTKGKNLLFDRIRVLKSVLFISFFINPLVALISVPLIYLAEALRTIFSAKRMLRPAFTAKTLTVIALTFAIEAALIFYGLKFLENRVWPSAWFLPALVLVGDLMIPVFVSLIVLAFKPFTYFYIRHKVKKATQKREQFKDLIAIGITGSYGKSSVKEFLYQILSEKFKVLKTEKNINAEIGIANTILDKLDSSYEIFVAEMGAYEKGKIKEDCRMVKPSVGILTGINEQHMATFGSMDNIIEAKFELFDSLPKNGIALASGGNKIIKSKVKNNVILVDLNDINNLTIEREYISFEKGSVLFKINVLGKHNLDNILLAITAAQKLGMSLEEISKACQKIQDKKIVRRNPFVIDSSYSANPTGVIADIEYLKLYTGKKIIVMPCLIELGQSSKEVHKEIAENIEQVCDLAILTTQECFEDMQKISKKVFYIENPEDALKKLKEFSGPEDVILLEGRVPRIIVDEIKKTKNVNTI